MAHTIKKEIDQNNESMLNKLLNPINVNQELKKERIQRNALNDRISKKIDTH